MAMRALVLLAQDPGPNGEPWRAGDVSVALGLKKRGIEPLLLDLSRAGIVVGRRGAAGGYWLARSADRITLADVVAAVDRPLADSFGLRMHRPDEDAPAVWSTVLGALRGILGAVSVADVIEGHVPKRIRDVAG